LNVAPIGGERGEEIGKHTQALYLDARRTPSSFRMTPTPDRL